MRAESNGEGTSEKSDIVYVLQHVYQFNNQENVTIIGIFSSYDAANHAFTLLSDNSVCTEYLDDLHIAAYELDKIHWQEWEFASTETNPAKK